MGANSTERLSTLVRAGCPFVWLVTHEEERALATLARLAEKRNRVFGRWTVTDGMVVTDGRERSEDGAAKNDPAGALRTALTLSVPTNRGALFALLDFHHYVADPMVCRAMRDAGQAMVNASKTVVFVGPVLRVPPELEKEIAVVDFDLPRRDEIVTQVRDIAASAKCEPARVLVADDDGAGRVAEACLGLTHNEVENVLAQSLIVARTFSIPLVLEEKRNIIRKSGTLDYYEPGVTLADVGGAGAIKRWLRQRSRAFSEEARKFGLPPPRGLLLLGVPGTGKSLIAKATGEFLQLPLLRLDAGRLFASLVGASEQNARDAVRVAESIAPAVLWIDELDKAFAGAGGGSLDGGTTQRVFATILTWMQEKTSPVFVVATANDVSRLPPELLRKGRWDEVFFVDLPQVEERREVLRLHVTRRGHWRDELSSALDDVAETTNGLSGAELEQVVVDALYAAFERDAEVRRLEAADLRGAARACVPLSKTMSESIGALRDWAKGRAAPARLEPQGGPAGERQFHVG